MCLALWQCALYCSGLELNRQYLWGMPIHKRELRVNWKLLTTNLNRTKREGAEKEEGGGNALEGEKTAKRGKPTFADQELLEHKWTEVPSHRSAGSGKQNKTAFKPPSIQLYTFYKNLSFHWGVGKELGVGGRDWEEGGETAAGYKINK